ncbi:hypothetical protein [Glaesserella parasuis]|uniref:hypothetical protein n=1 Tax=Glaesserella parasuis TaxID=738 RepID=UPI002436BAA2|nr:hypothetical protein [Glaesserella parasuis]MDG6359915.1 hypothetical protein [Glaesserella parasuis]
MDEMYTGEEGTPWAGSGITLTDLTFNAASVPTGPAAANATGGSGTSSTSGSSGTSSGGSTTMTPAPTPAPKVEELDELKATVDNSAQGGVIVKPREGSNGEPKTKAFQVDYQQPDGTNRTIWFKYENSQWKLDPTKNPQMNGISVDTNGGNGPIKLNAQTGEVTFAPSAVKDKTNVTITALDSQGIARKNATAQAAQEPQPAKPTAEIDGTNRGGAIVTPKENTNKFKLTCTDEQNKTKTLVYEKENGSWKLKQVDGSNNTQAPNGVQLSQTDGKVTLSPDAVKDRSQVKIESYNNEDRITQSADVTTTTDKVEYTNVVGNGNGTPTGRVGYSRVKVLWWWEDRWSDVYQDWGNDPTWGLQQVQEGKYGNSKPTSVSKDGAGAKYTWGNSNDTVYVHESLGIINDQSGKNYKLDFNFQQGNDTFRQDSKGIGAGSLIDGGTGIDLYRIAGGVRATTDKVKGFERIELMDNGAVIGIRYGDLKNSGLEGPVKIYKGLNVNNGNKVKVDLGNNNNDWLTDTNVSSSKLGDASGGLSGASWNKSVSPVTENGIKYYVYTMNNDNKHAVWIQEGSHLIPQKKIDMTTSCQSQNKSGQLCKLFYTSIRFFCSQILSLSPHPLR